MGGMCECILSSILCLGTAVFGSFVLRGLTADIVISCYLCSFSHGTHHSVLRVLCILCLFFIMGFQPLHYAGRTMLLNKEPAVGETLFGMVKHTCMNTLPPAVTPVAMASLYCPWVVLLSEPYSGCVVSVHILNPCKSD